MRFRPFILLCALLVAACGRSPDAPPPPPATTTAPSPRIVSTVPAATLNLVLIGAADQIVGVSKYDRMVLPADKQNLPVVGDYLELNYEQLVKLHPTALVIQRAESRIDAKLRQTVAQQHIELLNMQFNCVADIWTSARLLGKAAGREEAAEKAIAKAQAELKELAELYRDRPHPKVAYLVDQQHMVLCGGGNFVDEMITAAGGENVGAKAGTDYPEISRETLIKLAPDVLLIGASDHVAQTPNDQRLTKWLEFPVPAAAARRVYLITDGNGQMASVAIGQNVRALARLIHEGDPPVGNPAINGIRPSPAPLAAETRP